MSVIDKIHMLKKMVKEAESIVIWQQNVYTALHNIDTSWVVSGIFPVARGGTGLSTIALGGILYASALDVLSRLAPTAANQVLRSTAANALQFAALLVADIPNLPTSKITSGQFPLNRMPRAASGFLRGKGVGVNPAYEALVAGDIPNLNAAKITAGVFPVARGGTGLSTIALGGILYASALDTLSRLAPTAANQVLRSTAANALQFAALLAADIPNLDTAKIISGQFPLARMPRAASGLFLEGNGVGADPIYNALIAANIPNLPASKITSGRFPMTRMPDMGLNKIMVGQGAGSSPVEGDPIPKASDVSGSFTYTTAYGTAEQDISALFSTPLTGTTRRKYTVYLDLTNFEVDANFANLYVAVKAKVDGTNYRAIDRKTIAKADIAANAEPGVVIMIPAVAQDVQITFTMSATLAANRVIYYHYCKEFLE